MKKTCSYSLVCGLIGRGILEALRRSQEPFRSAHLIGLLMSPIQKTLTNGALSLCVKISKSILKQIISKTFITTSWRIPTQKFRITLRSLLYKLFDFMVFDPENCIL